MIDESLSNRKLKGKSLDDESLDDESLSGESGDILVDQLASLSNGALPISRSGGRDTP